MKCAAQLHEPHKCCVCEAKDARLQLFRSGSNSCNFAEDVPQPDHTDSKYQKIWSGGNYKEYFNKICVVKHKKQARIASTTGSKTLICTEKDC